MSTDIGIVRGVIELQDDFTSQLGLAEAALHQFSAENQTSLLAVAGAVGIVAAAYTAAAAAVYNLGQRGADVNDLEETMNHFSGSAEAAAANLEALRNGVKGTVEDFDLMKSSSHLLSAGVKLTAEDFGTLGSAAFVLQNRGLGGTKEMLDLVSTAMVTGRTRALSMALGVIDAGDAEADYAKTLGITKDQLSASGVAEAKRIAIMGMLKTAVKDAGAQERDFGEQIEYAKSAVANWTDKLASAIAASPALAAGMNAIQHAVEAAFSGENSTMIEDILDLIKKGVLLTIDFGLGAIEMARVVNAAWSLVKSGVLLVETEIVGVVAVIVAAVEQVSAVGEKMHILPAGATAAVKELRVQLVGMTEDLTKQTLEASLGVLGHSKFDATLDKLGGTLYTVRDAVDGAAASQAKHTVVVDIAAKNIATLAKMTADHTQIMIDHQKVEDAAWAVEKKSLEETTALWTEYFSIRAHLSGTTIDGQRADIDRWFNDEVNKLDASDKNWQYHYDALAALASEKLTAVGMDWDSVKDKSQEALDQAAERATNTFNAMISGSLHFSREALAEQLQKVHDATDAARGMGNEFVLAHNAAADAAAKQVAALEKIKAAAQAAALANRALGGSRTYDLSSDEGQAEFFKLNPMAAFTSQFDTKKYFTTHTIEDAMKAGLLNLYANWNKPTTPGFADGGIVTLGENGPERVALPYGSAVFPTGSGPGGSGGDTLVFNVNGTAEESARAIKKILMRELKSIRKFGSA